MSLGTAVLVLVVYALAVARVTRLITADQITDPVRLFIARRARPDNDRSPAEQHRWQTAAYFIECPWCVGFWLSLASAAAPVAIIGWPAWAVVPVALAASHLVGVFAFAADTEDIDITDEEIG